MFRSALLATVLVVCAAVAIAQQRQSITPPSKPPIPSLGKNESRPPENQPQTKEQPAQIDRRGTNEDPLIVETRNPSKTQAEAEEERADKARKAAADLWIVALTGALVGATVLQFFALSYQGYWVRRTVTSAERSLALIERALVVGSSVQTSALVRDRRIIGHRFNMLFINTGRTPANKINSNATIAVFDGNDIPAEFKYKDRAKAGPHLGILGPNVLMPIPIDIAIQDLVAIARKEKCGIMYGWVEYADIFDPKARRRTEFCAKIEVVGDPTILPPMPGGPSSFGFAVYGPYNATDGDCFYQPGQTPLAWEGELPSVTQPPPPESSSI